MALLSIIIPVYNVESYLRQTLMSIIAQEEAKDCEVIVINDGSTDNSLQIAKEFERDYSNIKVIDKENEGVSATRNRGIEESTGEYVFFVDADDIVHPDALKIIFDGLEEYRPDILAWQYDTFYSTPKLYQGIASDSVKRLDGDGRHFFNELMTKGWAVSLYTKAVSRELLYDIRLDTRLTYGEDMFFSWKCFLLARKAVFISAPLYYYRQTGSGAVTRYHANLYENYRTAFDEMEVFAVAHSLMSEDLLQDIDFHFASRLPALTSMEERAPYPYTEKVDHLNAVINDPRIIRALNAFRLRLSAPIYVLALKGDVKKMLSKAKKDRIKSKMLFPIKRLLK